MGRYSRGRRWSTAHQAKKEEEEEEDKEEEKKKKEKEEKEELRCRSTIQRTVAISYLAHPTPCVSAATVSHPIPSYATGYVLVARRLPGTIKG